MRPPVQSLARKKTLLHRRARWAGAMLCLSLSPAAWAEPVPEPPTPPEDSVSARQDADYGLALKQYVNRLAFLVARSFTEEPPESRFGLGGRRSPVYQPARFPQTLVAQLRFDAEGRYLGFNYVERSGNFRTDTEVWRAFQRFVPMLSPPPIPPGPPGPFSVWVRLDESGLLLAPPDR